MAMGFGENYQRSEMPFSGNRGCILFIMIGHHSMPLLLLELSCLCRNAGYILYLPAVAVSASTVATARGTARAGKTWPLPSS